MVNNMKTFLLLLLSSFISRAQIPYGDPQAFLVPPQPDTVVAVYDSIKSFIYWTTPPIPLFVQKEYIYDENFRISSFINYDLYEWRDAIAFDSTKSTFAYNEQGLLTEKYVSKITNGIWVPFANYSYTYDDDGYLLTGLYNSNLISYEWDDNHNLIKMTEFQNMDSINSYVWTYDVNDNRLSMLWRGIYSPGTPFRDLTFIQWTYDDENNHTGTLHLDKIYSEIWDTTRRVTKTYNEQNLLADSLEENFIDEFLSVLTLFVYDQNSNPDSIISFWWNDGSPENYQLKVQDYGNIDRLVSQIDHYWDIINSSWVQQLWYTWEYDENGNLIEEKLYEIYPFDDWYERYRITSVFDNNNLLLSRVDSREEADSTYYYFNTQTIVKSPFEKVISNFQIYPNPAYDHVVFPTEGITSGSVTITDITGKLIDELSITGNSTTWKFHHLKSGIYFYRCKSDKLSLSGKIVINP